jgi:hypothetical protein
MKRARNRPVTRIAMAISQSVCPCSVESARSSAFPVRKAMTTAAACEPTASTIETMTDHL